MYIRFPQPYKTDAQVEPVNLPFVVEPNNIIQIYLYQPSALVSLTQRGKSDLSMSKPNHTPKKKHSKSVKEDHNIAQRMPNLHG